jgi:hypothetical protein
MIFALLTIDHLLLTIDYCNWPLTVVFASLTNITSARRHHQRRVVHIPTRLKYWFRFDITTKKQRYDRLHDSYPDRARALWVWGIVEESPHTQWNHRTHSVFTAYTVKSTQSQRHHRIHSAITAHPVNSPHIQWNLITHTVKSPHTQWNHRTHSKITAPTVKSLLPKRNDRTHSEITAHTVK